MTIKTVKITKETTLGEALKANPAAAKVFESYDMGCKFCSAAKLESVEWGAIMHGVEPEELVAALNRAGKA